MISADEARIREVGLFRGVIFGLLIEAIAVALVLSPLFILWALLGAT